MRTSIAALFLSACSADVLSLEASRNRNVEPVSMPVAPLMHISIADNHTREVWWSFAPMNQVVVTERRLDLRGEVTIDATSGSARVLGKGRLELAWDEGAGRALELFTGAMFSPAPFASAFSAPESFPWRDELVASGRILSRRAHVQDGDGTYRSERRIESPRSDVETWTRALEIAVALEEAPCRATFTLEVSIGTDADRSAGSETLAVDCTMTSLEGGWSELAFSRPFWQILQDAGVKDRQSWSVYEAMSSAILLPLYSSSAVLLEKEHEWAYEMSSDPPPD